MHVAYVLLTESSPDADSLSDITSALLVRGVSVAGAVTANIVSGGTCQMALQILPGGPRICIGEALGSAAEGCKLGAGALENAVALTIAGITDNTQLLILNKFGKQEAAGMGFYSLIATAVLNDLPVVIGVTKAKLPEFLAFSDGAAQQLLPAVEAVLDWLSARTTSA
jgi:hypothetical protein